MIARLSILLPYVVTVRHGDTLPPLELDQGLYRVRIYPPSMAALNPADAEPGSEVTLDQVMRQLVPGADQAPSRLILMDGVPTIQANLLQIDFIKDSFDRRRSESPARDTTAEGDPPATLGFELANQFLMRLRSITRGGQIKALDPYSNPWQLQYLADDGSELPVDEALFRRRVGANMKWQVVGVNGAVWDMVGGLYRRNYSPQPWETLLLDADALLPEVGPSIALASAALECFSSWYLNEIARHRGLPAGLWEWINDRDDWYKEPSVQERFDQLLKSLTGRSLQEDPVLWQAFAQLRQARNSFSHEGEPLVGKKKRSRVTPELARELVQKTDRIIKWCEALIPEELRRPAAPEGIQFTFLKNLLGPLPAAQLQQHADERVSNDDGGTKSSESGGGEG